MAARPGWTPAGPVEQHVHPFRAASARKAMVALGAERQIMTSLLVFAKDPFVMRLSPPCAQAFFKVSVLDLVIRVGVPEDRVSRCFNDAVMKGSCNENTRQDQLACGPDERGCVACGRAFSI